MTGKMVYSKLAHQEILPIDLALLNNGIYILKITDGHQNVHIEKLIIK